MKSFLNKFFLICRIFTGSRLIIIERQYDKKMKKDKLILWGSTSPQDDQVKVLRLMADDIERDMKCRNLNFDPKRN